jgi:hypothetical protein
MGGDFNPWSQFTPLHQCPDAMPAARHARLREGKAQKDANGVEWNQPTDTALKDDH